LSLAVVGAAGLEAKVVVAVLVVSAQEPVYQ
jgi:hypothetical protein